MRWQHELSCKGPASAWGNIQKRSFEAGVILKSSSMLPSLLQWWYLFYNKNSQRKCQLPLLSALLKRSINSTEAFLLKDRIIIHALPALIVRKWKRFNLQPLQLLWHAQIPSFVCVHSAASLKSSYVTLCLWIFAMAISYTYLTEPCTRSRTYPLYGFAGCWTLIVLQVLLNICLREWKDPRCLQYKDKPCVCENMRGDDGKPLM